MQKLLLVVISFFYSQVSISHPETMGNITGENINLRTINHGFSGSIKNRLVQGYKKKGKFASELTIVDQDQKTVSMFHNMKEDSFGGQFNILESGKVQKYPVRFISLSKEENIYVMNFNGEEVSVFVNAESFEHGHYINPEYSTNYKGEDISFRLEGEACYGYSLHLITMIMGAVIF